MSETSTLPKVVRFRRELHALAELSLKEHETSAFLKRAVAPWAPQITDYGETGFWVDLGDPKTAKRSLLLRADMDALPIVEETGLSFASKTKGHMHACGHDGHMAALLLAGERLSQEDLEGLHLRLLFQPAEENGLGARLAIKHGALEGIDAAFGIHLWNELPLGELALSPHGIMAGVVELEIMVRGKGGHGAVPQEAIDPVLAASQLVVALQPVISRYQDPVDPAVLTIGAISGGTAFNVIPEEVRLLGTARGFSVASIAALEKATRRVAAGVALSSQTEIEVNWRMSTSPTVNDPKLSQLIQEEAKHLSDHGIKRVLTDYRTMAGEDFGEIAALVPSCFALLGSANKEKGLHHSHHSPFFDFDEDVLEMAVALHLAVVRKLRADL